MGRDRKELSPEEAELSGEEAAKSRSRSRETPDAERKVRDTSESMRKKRDSSEDGKGKRRRSRGSSDSEENHHRKHKSKRKSRNRNSSESDSDDCSSEDSESGSESEYSENESETETEEERRRRKKKERRRREEERERKRRKREKERKRRKDKEKEEDRRRRKKKEKKRKEKERAERGKTGAVTDSWGKYGIIRETDMWNKRPEFTAWLLEVKQVNLESLPNWEEKQMFKQFMEDHNTATFPSKKYYDLDAYHMHEMEKEMKKGMKKVRAVERTVFNDEEQRRQELLVERERHKEEQLDALKREMQGGMAQAMKDQAQLREEMAYQYKLGNFEAAAAIQRRLDPNLAM